MVMPGGGASAEAAQFLGRVPPLAGRAQRRRVPPATLMPRRREAGRCAGGGGADPWPRAAAGDDAAGECRDAACRSQLRRCRGAGRWFVGGGGHGADPSN